ncbi:epoxide hydrolase family protein [Qipengyuania oceanensis]|uniref:Alpha/beta fold hydrolase n=1 Tax=Qipengyuania oceanensis TaxID=1463597 RepID=A0A844YEU1_9SPHN|nr:epoxide hydrolase family protein [Qipengyuania oceanensis]MXO61578.1 alpha/beta fold hydrolase [Qipengyuania oceanensis]
MSDVRPFTLDILQAEIDRLHRKIDDTRWPEKEPVNDWSQGTKLDTLKDLVAYWRDSYDWRRCEAELNALGQHVTEIDGLAVHFLHVRSSRADAMPLLITHGWPGSVVEFLDVIPLLTEPEDGQPFHVIAPSLPGFGFSGKPEQTGWGVETIATAWAELMRRLGYERWVAQGGDWGSAVTTAIGAQAPEGCIGIHVNMPIGSPTPEEMANPSPEELKALMALKHYQDWDSGYSTQQKTRPQTVGYGLVDSPVGLAGWILEKMWAWTDNSGSPYDALSKDRILDNIMLYWLPATGASSARLYWESFSKFGEGQVAIPAGASQFPREIIPAPRKWAERRYTHLVYWNDLPKGGHFAAWEQPELFAGELRACFGKMVAS